MKSTQIKLWNLLQRYTTENTKYVGLSEIYVLRKIIETYDFEERLLIQMLFLKFIQQIWMRLFRIYTERKRVTDIIIRAYFTVKSDLFFMNDENIKRQYI